MKKRIIKTEMETENHSNGTKRKSRTGKRSLWKIGVLLLAVILSVTGCKKDKETFERKIDGETVNGAALMVLDSARYAEKLKQITDEGNVIFHNLRAEEIPQPKDIICSAPTEAAPQGFLYKVKEVKTEGNVTTIVTEDASLEEALEEASMDETIDLSDYIQEIETAEGVTIVPSTRAEFSKGLKMDVNTSIDLGTDSLVAVILAGSIEVNQSLECKLEIKNWTLDYFRFTLQNQLKFELSAGIEGKIEIEKKVRLAIIKCFPVVLPAGPLPVSITPQVSVDAIITIEGRVKIQAQLIDIDYSKTVGVEYKNKKWNTINENTSAPAKFLDKVELAIEGEVKLMPEMPAFFSLYNTGTGPEISLGFYTKLELEDFSADIVRTMFGTEDSNPKLKLSCGLELEIAAKLALFSKKFAELSTTFDLQSWTIWEREVFPLIKKIELFTETFPYVVVKSIMSNLFYYQGFCLSFPIKEYGFCWGYSPYPNKVENQYNNFGAATLNDNIMEYIINDIDATKTYYVRPYFTNFIGTFYGEVTEFGTARGISMTVPETVKTVNFSLTAVDEVSVDWGDGEETIYPNEENISCTHTYAVDNIYTITIKGTVKTLNCLNNGLTALDVSNSPELTRLMCSTNQLTSLDVSKNPQLTYLACINNQLTALDISQNTVLTEVYCGKNKLTTLDASQNTILTLLECRNNLLSVEALNSLFNSLHDNWSGEQKRVIINDNTGASDCDRRLALDKGWSFAL